MAIIEPLRQDIQHPDRIKKNSSAIRLWHWINAVIISGSLITVLINSTVLDERDNSSFLKSKLNNASVTDDQVNAYTHGLSDKIWGVHIYFGYALAAFFIFRLGLEIFQRKDQNFFGKLKKAYQDYFIVKKDIRLARHEFFVKALYIAFYILLLIMVLTGLTLVFKSELHLARSISHNIKEVHGFCMYLVIAFILVHILGVLMAERKDSKGIVSDMINGGQQ